MREQLIAAIENDPDDVENYRVYADWLEANGQPRGQLIQMDILRARLTDRAKQEHLRRRIAEYFAQNRVHFANGLPGWQVASYETMHGELRWRYGFIYAAQLSSGPEAPQRLYELFESPSGRFLVELGLALHADRDVLLAALLDRVPASLRTLVLHGERFDLSTAWPKLERLDHLVLRAPTAELGLIALPALRQLTCHADLADSIGEAVLPKLETLYFEHGYDASPILKLLDRLDAPVTELVLADVSCVNELVRDLSATRVGSGLTRVTITGYAGLTDEGAIAWAKRPPAKKLARLVVREAQLSKRAMQVLKTVAEQVVDA